MSAMIGMSAEDGVRTVDLFGYQQPSDGMRQSEGSEREKQPGSRSRSVVKARSIG